MASAPSVSQLPFQPDNRSHILGLRRRERKEGARGAGRSGVDDIEDETVKVWIQIQGGSKALDRLDRPALRRLHVVMDSGPPLLVGEERTPEGTQHLTREVPQTI
jgi:hypothetical protein